MFYVKIGGGEFCSNRFAAYCEDTGVARQYTTPYTPQQNGVVERRNCTVVAMVAHEILVRKMPYEAWTGNKPYLGHLRVFGCATYEGTKGCRLYYPESVKIMISRDVNSEGHEQEPATPLNSRSESENSVTIPQTPGTGESNFESEPSSTSSSSTEPVKFRLLSDIYEETPEVELENELLLTGIDEPSNFSQAVIEGTWKKAMEQEIEAI
ncbi:hypothetical protein AgCh_031140 [Apium graveolens]